MSPWDILLWSPPWCRWNVDDPPKFSIYLNILFAFAGTFTVANLYYSQPLLHILAQYFVISQEQASLIPTCSQAGYAAGLIFLCPLGDMVRRRPFVLLLTWITPTIWIGLCLTNSYTVFIVLSFLSSITTVTPQLMLPLVGDLTPPARRATSLSIVASGLVFGLLFARLLAGIIATQSYWRNIYWLSLGLQYLIFGLLWLFMPDYPSTNTDVSYFSALVSIVRIFFKYPTVAQATLIGFLVSATFTSFWTTLTFLLSGHPYNYSTLKVGLLSIAGLTPMFPESDLFTFRYRQYVPQLSIMVSLIITMIGISIGAYTGTFTIAGPVLQACLVDFGLQSSNVGNHVSIYAVAPKARNRVNTAYMVGAFCGQLMGTSVGNKVYAEAGWMISGIVSLVFIAVALIIGLARGPNETGWFGWTGGVQIRRVHEGEIPLPVQVEKQQRS